MNEQTLNFVNIEVNKKEFHASKQAIGLNLVGTNRIVISHKFNHSDNGFKFFISYKDDNIVGLLCIILLQMSGYIKYFKNREKNMSLIIKDDGVLVEYDEIWNKIQKTLNTKFHSTSAYDEK